VEDASASHLASIVGQRYPGLHVVDLERSRQAAR
jgi:hypothetical protein